MHISGDDAQAVARLIRAIEHQHWTEPFTIVTDPLPRPTSAPLTRPWHEARQFWASVERALEPPANLETPRYEAALSIRGRPLGKVSAYIRDIIAPRRGWKVKTRVARGAMGERHILLVTVTPGFAVSSGLDADAKIE